MCMRDTCVLAFVYMYAYMHAYTCIYLYVSMQTKPCGKDFEMKIERKALEILEKEAADLDDPDQFMM